MRLGIGSYTYGWAADKSLTGPGGVITATELLDRAARYHVEVVQIADNMPLHLLDVSQRTRLKEAARRKGIVLEIGTRGLTRENISRYIGIAAEMDSRILRVVIDAAGYEPDAAAVVSILREIESLLEQSGVTLAIENHDRFKAAEIREIVEKCASARVGVCLDSVNSLGAAEGIESVTNCLAPYTVNLHIKDFMIKRLPYLMGFTVEGRPAGQGMLDIPRLVDTVSRFHPDASAILELWTPPEKEPGETLAKESQWAKESLAYLRTVIQ